MVYSAKDSITRFSNRVENYIKYRPHYPDEVIDLLKEECGLTRQSVIADIGSGTGILTELFLKNGNAVFGVEPNRPMREAAERLLAEYQGFTSIDGAAEGTKLAERTIDFVVAGQAFHWFDQKLAREEFSRILKSKGWVALIWNERRIDSTAFLYSYEQMLLKYSTDYQDVRHENAYEYIATFFAPGEFKLKSFANHQQFDFAGVKGRLLSSSYAPAPDAENFGAMIAEVRNIFDQHAKAGQVVFEYDTRVYFGQLKH